MSRLHNTANQVQPQYSHSNKTTHSAVQNKTFDVFTPQFAVTRQAEFPPVMLLREDINNYCRPPVPVTYGYG